VNIPRDDRSSEHLSFLLGRQYLPRYAPSKLEKLPFMGTTRSTHTSPILAILGVLITLNERSSIVQNTFYFCWDAIIS
jgi:hypothetical protein